MAIARSITSLVFLLGLAAIAEAAAPASTNETFPLPSYCPTSCGDVSVFFPFGIGEGCFRPGFDLICNTSSDSPQLFLSDGATRVKEIVLNSNTNYITVYFSGIFTFPAGVGATDISWAEAPEGPYSISTSNLVTVVGCYATAALINGATNLTVGTCETVCGSDVDMRSGACIGAGCCQIAFTGSLKSFWVQFSRTNLTRSSASAAANSSVKVFVSEIGSYAFDRRDIYDGGSLNGTTTLPVRMDWYIPDHPTCGEAAKDEVDYACVSNDSYCNDWGGTGLGYVCYCAGAGADRGGNPYVPQGCEVHECTTEMCSKLVFGLAMGMSIGIGLLILTLMAIFMAQRWKKMNQKKSRQKNFHQNHGLLLQQLISSNEDLSERTKMFSLEEMEKATNNFDSSRILGLGGHATVYKGILLDLRVVAIKKSKLEVKTEIDQFINEVAILSRINHRNIVQLYGCCLETEVPLLVYEFISNGTLYSHLHSRNPASQLSWEERLRIATEAAGALAYLHSAANISILHRDVKSSNILVDENCTAKVSDFGASRIVPISQTHVLTTVQGTHGYLDPEYYRTGRLTKKSDVYGFGVIILELVTGKKPIWLTRCGQGLVSLGIEFLQAMKENRHYELIEDRVKLIEGDSSSSSSSSRRRRNSSRERGEEIDELVRLASMCLSIESGMRPTMREVEFTLQGIVNRRKDMESRGERNILADRYITEKSLYSSSRNFSLEEEFMASIEHPR